MNLLRLIALLVDSFGVYVFGAFVVYRLQHADARCSGVRVPTSKWAERVGMTILVFCFFWFLLALMIELSFVTKFFASDWLQLIQVMGSLLFPPLIMHVAYVENAARAPERFRHPLWKASIGLVYLYAVIASLLVVAIVFRWISMSQRQFGIFIGASIGGMFALASIFALVTSGRTRSATESAVDTSERRWTGGLYLLMLPLCVGILIASAQGASFGHVLRVVGSSMPLAFIFTGTYFDQRFVFFDVLLKRGLALLLTIVLLTAYFGATLPWIAQVEPGWVRPWVLAVLLLPLAMGLPWLHRRTSRLIDSFWLRRQFSTVNAVKRFLAGMQRATSEDSLVAQAESGLREIFRAPVRIDLQLRQAPPLDFDCVVDLPISSGSGKAGVILMGRRDDQTPYFSEDLELLASLADVFSYMLENVRLQKKKQEQEQRANELSLQASRTELKALRAQINPHFLFNALNVIAGLIHKDPMRADATVEQLAEVFRYTLRGSQKEWAKLSAELEFVQAYLDVEQARFGDRLQVRIDTQPGVGGVSIPTMVVQTLVENAVKHGIASVTGQASIEVVARREGDQLVIEVADNGRGLSDVGREPQAGRPKGTGYGLKNIRERLSGYFGEEASLSLAEDDARGMTVASVRLPLDHGSADSAGQPGSQGVA